MNSRYKKSLNSFELYIFDMDGVIFKGTQIIPKVKSTIEQLYKNNKKIVFFTNNSTLTPENYIKKLGSMGIQSSYEQIITSSLISAKSISEIYNESASAYFVGENGLFDALKSSGIFIVNEKYSDDEIIKNPDIKSTFVIVGLDRELTYQKISTAGIMISRGADFYATNGDSSLPNNYGFMPGAGAIISSVATTTGKQPIKVFGKPSPVGIIQILEQFKVSKENAIMIGDRPETDILCGLQAEISTALVLTGVINKNNISSIPENHKPEYIIEDLSKLL
ncbi:MAG TPA: HAD-IIA family hydrolase [Victivallales bacterium]|nr:HAD-IIA family hydrolase [Victivallales bacterium]